MASDTDIDTPEPDPVLYEVGDDHVATITLNRPHRRNAISIRMLNRLSEVLTKADDSVDVRAIVLTGAGKGFCAGLDIKDAMSGTGIGGSGGDGGGGGATVLQNTRSLPTSILFEIDTPIIAAVNGAAAGYGLDLALGCDMRLLGESSRLMPGFAKRGVVPESGGTWYLPRLVGWAKAAEIGFLGRDLDAQASKDIGLANAVVPDDQLVDEAHAWAREIAANAPLAIRAMKRLYRHGLTEDFPAHTHHVLLQTMQLFGTKDFFEGISSFAEGREPEFRGR
ncbi:enoyl-CoA hydratase/isomerase family protein [Actinospongicola halichondriae]|uniref:enoyl-CoA hydratase/isomerase family protein n=1 Tax=Actinospongicola halichondriae TaxID=3236844 RepID=UPI003D417E75